MAKKKIFLASSSELKDDRKEFEIYIGRKNKEWHDKGIFLELILWEDFLDAMSQTRLQDEYNKAIRECDIFVMLFFTKVGKYTNEEFETAFGEFKKTNKPFIYTYFKDAPITTGSMNPEDLMSLSAFKFKLGNLGHFYTRYKSIGDLKFQFEKQLDRLADSGFIQFEQERKPDDRKLTTTARNEPVPVSEIVDFDEMLSEFEQMISGENPKKIMFIVARDGRGKTSLLRKMHHRCQSQKVPCCLIDLSETYDFPHLELAREICEGLQVSMTDFAKAPELVSSSVGNFGTKVFLNNEALNSGPMKRRLTRSLATNISSANKMMVCLFDSFDTGTRIVEDWFLEALMRPIREGGLNNLLLIIAGSAWPKKINDVEWKTHAEFKEGMPEMSENHLLDFAESIGCELSPAELDVCWLGCERGNPQLMNTFIKTICRSKRSNG